MNISDFEHKNIAIWGVGKEGIASYHALRALFPTKKIRLINQKPIKHIPKDSLTDFILESDIENHLDNIDIIIKAPGISLYHPLIKAMQKHDITVTSATNIWFAEKRNAAQKGHTKVIALTGSNGKSTTSALLAHILEHLDLKVALGGNIGTPLLSLPDNADYYIIELSSYQTADLHYAPNIAVLLNLYPEHIQWHQSHEQYYHDKCNLIHTGADTVILNRTDPKTKELVNDLPQGTCYFNDPKGLHITRNHIMNGPHIVGKTEDFSLPGPHNLENLCAALTACHILQLDLKNCFTQACSFKGLEHRLESLGKRGRHYYINDSISTTPEAAISALKSLEEKHITLIAGGQDRQQDYHSIAKYISDHPNIRVISLYETGSKIALAMKDAKATPAIMAHDLKDAVKLAREITPAEGTILLSPAAPSYDAFKNFAERGNNFKSIL